MLCALLKNKQTAQYILQKHETTRHSEKLVKVCWKETDLLCKTLLRELQIVLKMGVRKRRQWNIYFVLDLDVFGTDFGASVALFFGGPT